MANIYTLAEIEAALEENADFEEAGSVSKAKAFVTAANRWLIRRPESASDQASSLTIGKSFVMSLRSRAIDYINANAANSATSRVRFFSVESGFKG